MNIVYFFLLAFFWGTAFIGVKYNVAVVDPYVSAFLRVFISFIFFGLWFLIAKKPVFLPRKDAWRPWLAGFLIMGLPFVFLYWGQQFIPAGTGGIFNGTVPLWVFIIAAFTLKGQDAFSWQKAIGVIMGFLGLLLVLGPAIAKFMTGVASEQLAFYGSISLLLMAICYAAGNVLTKYILNKNITMEQNIFHQHFFSVVFLFFMMLLSGAKMPGREIFEPKVIISIFYVALFSSALALLLLFKLLKEWGALKASAATYLAPIIALAADFLLNGRAPNIYEIGGVIIIFLSLFLIQYEGNAAKAKR
ncbi:MAG: DMT family transporter [Elusimicrobiota bacterium]|jgi:drug/metabolite transporter (DMT)-like permease|nr:DMT family transporter [Elusimicrobiota bacterium]